MRAVSDLLIDGGLAIIVTVFAWPEHGDYGTDFWRFTRSGLEELANVAGLDCLGSGTMKLNQVCQHAYIVCSKGRLGAGRNHNIEVPRVINA
jgi:hypothetical protein